MHGPHPTRTGAPGTLLARHRANEVGEVCGRFGVSSTRPGAARDLCALDEW